MKRLNSVLILALAILGVVASAPVAAAHHGGHMRFGVYVGPGYWYPPSYYTYPPYYYPPYYYPPAVVAPAAPPTYIEQGVAQPGPAQVAPAPAQPQCLAGWPRHPGQWFAAGQWLGAFPKTPL